MLKNKKILLAVCGSIAFYKAYEILRELRRNGADVYIALSDGALKFCSELGFEALCDHKILSSNTQKWQDELNHIAYAKMDLILIAPASVNTINRLANGICDTVFMQTLIASNAPILIALSANDKMIAHFSTQNSIKFLKQNGVKFIEPVEKILACGDLGKGALASVETIIHETKKMLCGNEFAGQNVVITGGATIEKIDDVRAITNFSSGKMAKALAYAFYYAGANVTLIASFEINEPLFNVVKFQSSAQLNWHLNEHLKTADMLIMVAAVSDYKPVQSFKGKLKKQNLGQNWDLKLVQNDDILANLSSFTNVKKIGFKMEFDEENALKNAQDMLNKKNLNAVCLNVLNDDLNFGSNDCQIRFITCNEDVQLKLNSKEKTAQEIVNLAAKL